MSLNTSGIIDGIASHAMSLGLFERVNQHEPKNAPGLGLTCVVWADRVAPVPAGSGLQSTTGLIVFNVRVYTSMLSEPQDAIDPNLLTAVDALMAAYSGDFDLGGTVRNVDLLGQAGTPLSAQAGYVDLSGKIYRIMTVTLPVIVNDLWDQVM